MSGGIRLSPKHGVNPTIPLCFFCRVPKNEVILAGRLPGDVEAPHAVWDKRPCDECAGFMKQGVICLSVRDGESGDNPYRTGRFAVLTDDAIRWLIAPPELVAAVLKHRVCFIPDEAWAMLGIPASTEAPA